MRLLTALILATTAIPAQAQLAEPLSREKMGAKLDAVVTQADFSGTIGVDESSHAWIWAYTRVKAGKTDQGYVVDTWRWASVTKQVVAVLVMQEVARGTIDLDQPLSKYIPNFASANASKITVRQLLRHQSGLPNPDDVQASAEPMSAYYLPAYKGNRDPLTGYCAGKPKSEPGGNWSYNNCDYIIAGALLEAVTGTPWPKLVQERISKPLGLRTVGVYPTKGITHTGFVGGRPETKLDLSSFAASGAIFGSVQDLLKFDRALMSGELLAQKELNQMWDAQAEMGYIALGQWVFDAKLKDCEAPVKLVERRGSIGGVQVRNFMALESETAIAIFADKSEDDFQFGEIWQGTGFSHDVLNIALCVKADKNI